MTSITHVIFDLDGTLLDTEDLYGEAAQNVCSRFGAIYTLELKRRIMGGDTMRGAKIVVDELRLPLTPEQYIHERETELLRLFPSARPMPGAEALVQVLRERKVGMAIATSGHRALTVEKLKYQPFLDCIDVVVCGDDTRLRHPKPAPDIFLLAAADLHAHPAHCAVIEDSLNGVRGGIAAGMRTIALVDRRWRFEDDQFTGASLVVHSLEALTLEALGVV